MSSLVIGVDPGAATGLFAMHPGCLHAPIAVQVHGPEGVLPLVKALLERRRFGDWHTESEIIAVEEFVVGGRAARSSTPNAGRIARNLIGQLLELEDRVHVVCRPAATVKPWATDKRLEAAGLLEPTSGIQHARDAARHALYAAVHAGLMPDPLSSKAVAR